MYITSNPINQQLFNDYESITKSRSNSYSATTHSVDSNKFTNQDNKNKFNLPVLATTLLGVLASVFVIRKYKGLPLNPELKISKSNGFINNLKLIKNLVKNFLDIDPELKELLILVGGSISGGVAGGVINDKNQNTKPKIKEGIHQFLNQAIPAAFVAGLIGIVKKHKCLDNWSGRIGATVLGLGVGIPTAAHISNKLNNSIIDKHSKSNRSVKLKDCFIHIDDILTATVLADPAHARKLGVDKMVPILYLLSGYEAGKAK